MIDFTPKFDGLQREKVTIAKAARRTLPLRSRVFVPSAPAHRSSVGYPERLPADSRAAAPRETSAQPLVFPDRPHEAGGLSLTIRRDREDHLSALVHMRNTSEVQKDESKG
jgi:hypothetical protein